LTPLPRRLFLASAGTGKTYQLTNRFLALLAAGVPPGRILATTFTRKAAGEILDRVLARLAGAAAEVGQLEALNRAADLQPPLRTDDARRLLRSSALALDRFQVRTLDSFFIRLAQIFDLELGLPPGWRVIDELEDEEQRAEALMEVLDQADPRGLIELLRELQKGGAQRSVHDRSLRLLRQTYDTLLESEPEAWSAVQAPALPADQEIHEALGFLDEFEAPLTKAGKPSKPWSKELERLQLDFGEEAWEALVTKGLGAKLLAGEPVYHKHEIAPELARQVEVLLRASCHHLLQALVAQNAATRRLLAEFDGCFHALKQRSRGFRFEDVPRALLGRESALPAGEQLAFRYGGGIEHLLLDEFQDTSVVQWRVLEPLARAILERDPAERSFFCVGDLKQSIYGWRSGEPRLLGELHERYPELEVQTLERSWRSSPVVLGAVNQVFREVADNPALADPKRADAAAAARRWQRSFRDHEAAEEALPGRAELRQAPAAADGEDQQAVTLRYVAERAAAAARSGKVAVLLRRKQPMPRLIYELQRLGVRASGEGGNPLTDSSAVLAALSLLWLADHPGDSAAAFHVSASPLAALVGLEDGADSAKRAALARRLREQLLDRGYGELLAEWAPAFAEAGSWDRRRYGQLVERGFAWDARATLRPSDFVRAARELRVEDPSSSRVKIMTVHAAKGLEFDTVILADLDSRLTGKGVTLLTQRPDPYGPLTAVSRPLRKALERVSPVLAELGQDTRRRDFSETLCVLYVALTRAARGLEMVVGPPSGNLSFAALLRGALVGGADEGGAGDAAGDGAEASGADLDDEGGGPVLLWRHPDSVDALPPAEEGGAKPPSPPAPPSRLELAAAGSPRLLPRRSPSAAEGGPLVRPAELLRLGGDAARRRGSLIHRWFEELEWVEDFTPDRERLLEAAAALGAGAEEAGRELEGFLEMLRQPELRRALSREAQPAKTRELWRERRFSLVVEDGPGQPALRNGSFDRVVLFDGAAEVIDFKTDRVGVGGAEGPSLESRSAFYAPQMELYRDSLARITALAPAAIRLKLLFVAAGVVVELPGPGACQTGQAAGGAARD